MWISQRNDAMSIKYSLNVCLFCNEFVYIFIYLFVFFFVFCFLLGRRLKERGLNWGDGRGDKVKRLQKYKLSSEEMWKKCVRIRKKRKNSRQFKKNYINKYFCLSGFYRKILISLNDESIVKNVKMYTQIVCKVNGHLIFKLFSMNSRSFYRSYFIMLSLLVMFNNKFYHLFFFFQMHYICSFTECDQTFVSRPGGPQNGSFVSPVLNNMSNHSRQCLYIFLAGPGQRVEIVFNTFNLRGSPPEYVLLFDLCRNLFVCVCVCSCLFLIFFCFH